ncbi:4-alpha-glucanotransferase [Planoprotostelium fungivorum]|uniref:4-alpha-glucanotransferase n=1 Tax=Planoprotostelium fungivorum TaxID=1890364 RepID=A0A2P6NQZ8_9EUKA|nr:4-alpha-glucanotransferase [Planoprotostelium fungivorum]
MRRLASQTRLPHTIQHLSRSPLSIPSLKLPSIRKMTTNSQSEESITSLEVRRSGILLHPTSLPGPYGIGDVGPASIKFLDWMHEAGQTLWQFLPLNPHGHAGTPYAVPSAMAASPAMIALEPLLDVGLLKPEDVKELTQLNQEKVDYNNLTPLKRKALRLARDRFRSGEVQHEQLGQWKEKMEEYVKSQGKEWLEDFALFMAISEDTKKCWVEWPAELRNRSADALDKARQAYADAIDEHYFNQFLFAEQWKATREKAANLNIKLVGDIPIFVAYDSADVWANQKLFKLNAEGRQTVQAGVPPDYFSATGQLWGNPMYDWKACAEENYKWWALRFRRTLALADIVRIDHFRGFQAAWEVPITDKTAQGGKWVEGAGDKVFKSVNEQLKKKIPIIAEDLGLITKEVTDLREGLQFPGMRVLQFAWDSPNSEHLPHNVPYPGTVIYTGTHDNDTVRGFAEKATPEQRRFLRDYLGRSTTPSVAPGEKRKRGEGDADVSASSDREKDEAKEIIETASWDMIRLAISSTAYTSIVQLQDVLDLGSEARMNTPATAEGNWAWRLKSQEALTSESASKLKHLVNTYGRASASEQPEKK